VAAHAKRTKKAGRIYVGCSGWAYASWKPEFYPASLPAKKFLEYYAAQLNSVEVNYTFRTLPSEDAIRTWLAAAGRGFRFSFKAPQRITHLSRLKNCRDALDALIRAIAPVHEAKRLGVVLFQLPPNMKADRERLAGFLSDASSAGLGAGLRMAFEFRHGSWFAEETYSLLREHSAALCVAESDELATPDVRTAPFSCYRLRKSAYREDDLEAIRGSLRTRAQRGDVFAYFKHEEEPVGALRARSVLEGLKSA
jgi:uncharacterized protein YecE (DUF72 family)